MLEASELGALNTNDVRAVQVRLNQLPSSLPRLVVDGVFGNTTRARLMEFQRLNGLSVTGAVDAATSAKLFGYGQSPAAKNFQFFVFVEPTVWDWRTRRNVPLNASVYESNLRAWLNYSGMFSSVSIMRGSGNGAMSLTISGRVASQNANNALVGTFLHYLTQVGYLVKSYKISFS